jgi:hypothetical protein
MKEMFIAAFYYANFIGFVELIDKKVECAAM